MFYLSAFSVLCPLLLGVLFFKRIDLPSRWIVLLVSCAAFPQLASLLPVDGLNLPLFYNAYTLVDTMIWAIIFYQNIRSLRAKVANLMIFLLQLAATLCFFVAEGISARFYHELVCLNSIVLVIRVLTFFYERYLGATMERIEEDAMFWFCLGVLIYCPTTYFLFAFHEIFSGERSAGNDRLWNIHHLLNAAMYLIFGIGIIISAKASVKPERHVEP